MRELKFRAWIKDRSEMWYITGFVYDLNKKKVRLFRMNSGMTDGMGSEVFRADNVILQQFTGLTDRNEKDVYEGDILKHANDIGTVVFGNNNGAWCLSLPYIGTGIRTPLHNLIAGIMSGFTEPCFEKLGNVHENPDLI